MECWMLWHGGASYAHGSVEEDIEHFDSIKAALEDFDSRADSSRTYYPCVERDTPDNGGQSAWLFFSNPNDEGNGPGDPYPDRIIEYGPRGGLHVNYA